MRRPKKLIEQAYTLGAQLGLSELGLSVWCEDEAGPFQAVPHPGVSWQPREHPAKQPHEYIRGGTTRAFECPGGPLPVLRAGSSSHKDEARLLQGHEPAWRRSGPVV